MCENGFGQDFVCEHDNEQFIYILNDFFSCCFCQKKVFDKIKHALIFVILFFCHRLIAKACASADWFCVKVKHMKTKIQTRLLSTLLGTPIFIHLAVMTSTVKTRKGVTLT